MKNALHLVIASSLLFSLCPSCGDPGTDDISQGTERRALDLTPFSRLNAGPQTPDSHAGDWSESRLVPVFSTYGYLYKDILTTRDAHYPRMQRMSDGSYIITCHDDSNGSVNGRNVYYATSPDLRHWTRRGALFAEHIVTTSQGKKTSRVYTNGQLLVLRSGDVLAIASYRLDSGYGLVESQHDHGIVMRRSTDCAATWSDPVEIYHGTNWEGMLLELPSGQIQCYFSESRPWISSGHSGTGMIWSDDGGKTWTPGLDRVGNPYTVVREKYVFYENGKTLYTDQMPAVVKLNDGEKYAGAFEARKSNSSSYGITLAYSDTFWKEITDNDGSYPVVTADKCGPADKTSYAWVGTAPTITQFPSGETVVGYSAAYSGSNHLWFRIGDAGARNFDNGHVLLGHQGSWGSVNLIGSHELALINRDSYDEKNVGVSYVICALNHRISASSHEVKVDGRNADWSAADEALFVGSKQNAQVTLRCSQDGDNVCFLVEVIDERLSAGDFIDFMMAPEGTSEFHYNCINISGSPLEVGQAMAWGENGWTEDRTIKSKGFAGYDGTLDDDSDLDNGFLCEFSIPRNRVPAFDGRIIVNLAITRSDGTVDSLGSMTKAENWMVIDNIR